MASNNYFFFLNRRNSGDGFRESINSKYFVDKSLLIDVLNSRISTKDKWNCVSRPRRFDKTQNAIYRHHGLANCISMADGSLLIRRRKQKYHPEAESFRLEIRKKCS